MHKQPASPAPGGVVAYAVACYTFFGVFMGYVTGEGLILLGAWLLGGFAVQTIVCKGELEEGALLGGNVFLFFQGFFMLTGAVSSIAKYLCLYVWMTPYSTVVEGFGWMACALALILWTPAYMKTASGTFSLAIILTDIALIGVVLNDFGVLGAAAAWVKPLTAWCLFAGGTLGIYFTAAVQLQAAFGKVILPLAKPMIKDKTASQA